VIYDQWKASPHAANSVECTVCHGETTSGMDFAGTPALSTCATCHDDQVAQLKSDPFMKGRTCVSCHQAHIFVEHKKAPPVGK
jgi:cytochrome c553